MKPLNPYTHGYLDYAVGLLLVVSPWLFGFDDVSSVATVTMVVVGLIVLLLSIMTDYPLGIIKAVPFKVHGVIETIGALFLLVSPWLLNYNIVQSATILAVVVALAWLVVVAMTRYTEHYRRPVT